MPQGATELLSVNVFCCISWTPCVAYDSFRLLEKWNAWLVHKSLSAHYLIFKLKNWRRSLFSSGARIAAWGFVGQNQAHMLLGLPVLADTILNFQNESAPAQRVSAWLCRLCRHLPELALQSFAVASAADVVRIVCPHEENAAVCILPILPAWPSKVCKCWPDKVEFVCT